MRKIAVATALAICAAPILAFAEGARDLKESAIGTLASAKTGDKKIDRALDEAIDHLRRSLADRAGTPLFVAADRILPGEDGRRVFVEEEQALDVLEPLSRDKKAPSAVLAAVSVVASDLVAADRRIAAEAIDAARPFASTNERAAEELRAASRALAQGDANATALRSHQAIEDYEHAWEAAERSVEASNPPPEILDPRPAPDGFVRTKLPLLGATIESVLDLRLIDPKSIALSLDGAVLVNGATGLEMRAVTFDAAGGRATVSLVAPQPLVEGDHTVTVSGAEIVSGEHGPARTATKTWHFFVDTQPPRITPTPADREVVPTETPTITIGILDPLPGSGVNFSTLAIALDSADVTNRFSVSGGTASWTVPDSAFLAEGVHHLRVQVSDLAGNLAVSDTTFLVDSIPVGLRIALNTSPVVAGATNGISVSAVTSHGQATARFQGFVAVETTDPRSLLDGLLLSFTAADRGVRTVPQVAVFFKAGTQTITATTEPGTTPSLQGTLSVTVQPGPPAAFAFVKGGVSTRVLGGTAPRPFALVVEDAFANVRHDAGVTLVASIAAVDTTTAPSTFGSATDTSGVARFALPVLPTGDYVVAVTAPGAPLVPAVSFSLHVVALGVGDLFVALPTDPVAPGATFTAHVLMNVGPASGDPSDLTTVLGGYDVCLYHDAERLTPLDVAIVTSMGGFAAVNTAQVGLVAVSDYNSSQDGATIAAPVRGLVELFSVNYLVSATAPGGGTSLGAEVFDAVAASVDSSRTLGAPTPRPSISGSGLVTILGAPAAVADFRTLAGSPLEFTAGLSPIEPLALHFSAPVDLLTLISGVTLARAADGVAVATSLSLANEGYTAIVQPLLPLAHDVVYVLSANSSLTSGGAPLSFPFEASYVSDVSAGPLDVLTRGNLSTADVLQLTRALFGGAGAPVPASAAGASQLQLPALQFGKAATKATTPQTAPAGPTAQTQQPPPPPGPTVQTIPLTVVVRSVSPAYVNGTEPNVVIVVQTAPHVDLGGQVAALSVTYSGPGGATRTVTPIASGGNQIFAPPPPRSLPEGSYSVTVNIVPKAGIPVGGVVTPGAGTLPAAFFLDEVPPSVAVIAAQQSSPGQFALFTSAQDISATGGTASGLSFAELEESVGSSSFTRIGNPIQLGGTLLPRNLQFSAQLQPNQVATFRVRAVDLAGNEGFSPTIQLDTIPPSLSVLAFTHFAPGTASFQVQVSDDEAPLLVKLFRDGTEVGFEQFAASAPPPFTATDQPGRDGSYSYFFTVSDPELNVARSQTFNVIVDTVPPAATLTASSTLVTSQGQSVTLSYSAIDPIPTGTSSGLATVEIHRISGQTDLTLLAQTVSGNVPAAPFTDNPASDGYYSYYVKATDNAGNVGLSPSVTVLVSRTPPAIAFSPSGTYLNAATPALEVTITDLLSITGGSILINGTDRSALATTNEALVGNTFVATITLALDRRFVDGPFNVTVNASDQAHQGNASHSYILDRASPTIAVTQPATGTATNSGTVTIAGTWTDATSGVNPTSAQLVLKNVATGLTTTMTPTIVTATGFQHAFALADGAYSVTISVQDQAGNSGAQSTAFVVDTQAPTIIPKAPAPLSNDSRPILGATIMDSGTGTNLASIRVTLDGQDVTSQATVSGGSSPGATVTVAFSPTTPIPDGLHSFRVSASDNVSNAASAAASFQTDATPPTPPGSPIAGPRPLAATVVVRWMPSSDAGSGVAYYLLEISADNFATIAQTVSTTNTSAEIPTPTAQTTQYRLSAFDNAGNQSQTVVVRACEVFCIRDLTRSLTTSAQVALEDASGAPVRGASVVETVTGTPLPETGTPGTYRSGSIATTAGQSLNLSISAVANGLPVSTVSGSLLAADALTDFSTIILPKPSVQASAVSAGGLAPIPTSVGATVGEAFVAGPPALVGSASRMQASGAGFWQATQDVGPQVYVLLTPPHLCCRYIPIYYLLSMDDGSPESIQVDFSADGGVTFTSATAAAGGDGQMALASSPNGIRHVFVWDAGTDLQAVGSADVIVRVSIPGDSAHGSTSFSYLHVFQVLTASPAANQTGVAAGATITLGFNEPVTTNLVNVASSIQLVNMQTGQLLGFTPAVAGSTITLTPSRALPSNTWCQVVVLPSLNALNEPGPFDQDPFQFGLQSFLSTFRVSGNDPAPPNLLSSNPADGAGKVPTSSSVQLVFDHALDAATVTTSTFTMIASGGDVPESLALSPDGTVVTITPASALPAGQLVTVAVGPSLATAAGVPLNRYLSINFTTAPSSVAPPPPTILSPVSSPSAPATITTNTVAISGTALPFVVVRLLLNGFPTQLQALTDSSGSWQITTFPLTDGLNTVRATASLLDGTTSAPSNPIGFVVSTGNPAPLQPNPFGTFGHEVVAGPTPPPATGTPCDRVTISFSGNPGQPFVVAAQSVRVAPGLPLTAGFMQHAQVSVDPANGGTGSFAVSFSSLYYGAPGQLTFDATGTARVTFVTSDVTPEEYQLWLADPTRPGEPQISPTHVIAQLAPTSAIVAGASLPATPVPVQLGVRGNVQINSTQPPQIVASANRPVQIQTFWATAQTGSVTLQGAGGSPGPNSLFATTDQNGNVEFTLEAPQGTPPFSLGVVDGVAYTFTNNAFKQIKLGESVIFNPPGVTTGIATLTYTTTVDPVNNASIGLRNDLSQTCDWCRCLLYGINCPMTPPPTAASSLGTDPAYLSNGQTFLQRVDLVIPGRGVASLAFVRTYKSNVLYDGVLGHGWTHNFEIRLQQTDANTVTWLTGNTRAEAFTKQADGSYRGPVGYFVKLLGTRSQFDIRTPDGIHFVFNDLNAANAPGMIAQIYDSDGKTRNTLDFQYGTSGVTLNKLVTVADPYGHSLTYIYDPLTGRLIAVRESTLQRTVTFTQSAEGDLIKATTPPVMTTTTGAALLPENQFPNGKSEIYAYTAGFADERLNHKMTLIVAPNEAASVPDTSLTDQTYLASLARTQNTWNSDPLSPNFGRLVSQRLGGTNSTGVAAGGTFTFDYQALTPSGTDPINDEVLATTVKDRAGNLKQFFHNAAGQCVRSREYTNRNLRPIGTAPGQVPAYYETVHRYNADGLRVSTILPMGNQILYTFDSTNPSRYLQGKLLTRTFVPDSRGDSRGSAQPRTVSVGYEPIFGQLRSFTDERGNDPTYVAQNGGTASPDRYTTTRYFDYQQTATVTALAQEMGLDVATVTSLLAASGVQLGLGDLNNDSSDDSFAAGHVVKIVAPPVTLTAAQSRAQAFYGSTQAIVTLLSHNSAGQPTRVVDPEHNVHTSTYFSSNNPTGAPGVQGNGDLTGYLASLAIDVASDPARETGANPAPTNLSTFFSYDAAGNVIGQIDGRGIAHELAFNSLNQVVHTKAASSTAGAYLARDRVLEALGYEAHVIYDANNNVVHALLGNQGERTGTGAFVATNPFWSLKRRFDILDDPIRTIQEVTPIADDSSITETSPGVIVSELRYDPNQNLSLVLKPEGNMVAFAHDERDQLISVTRGYGSASPSTVKWFYNANSAAAFFVDAVKNNPQKHTFFTDGDVWVFKYDGFDREICVEDAETNCGDTVFDPADHVVRKVKYGPDEEGSPRLAEVSLLFDEVGRSFQSNVDVFPYTASSTTASFDRSIPTISNAPLPGEQFATSVADLDALGRTIRALDPKQDESLVDWDGASRTIHGAGPLFANRQRTNSVRNEAFMTYDGASNPIRRIDVERSPVPGSVDEQFVTDFVFDALGRQVRTTDPIGQTSRVLFDSRSNVIAASDAKSAAPPITNDLVTSDRLPAINDSGNVVNVFHDGISRPIRSERYLKKNGFGDGTLGPTSLDTSNPAIPTGIVATQTLYDKNSRVIGRIDANGNQTSLHYDELDRSDVETPADLTARITVFDADDHAIQRTDANGTIVQQKFDGISRLLQVNVTSRATNLAGTGQGVLGTTLQAFEWDGLSRLRGAIDDNGAAATLGVATTRTFDSVSRLLSERHQINASVAANNASTTNNRLSVTATAATIDRTVVSGYAPDAFGSPSRVFFARTSLQYPTSGRTLTFGIDGLDRTQTVTDQAASTTPLVGYEFVGSRAKTRDYANGVSASFTFDGDRRLTQLTHTAGPALIAGFAYGWDQANNRLFEQKLHQAGQPQDTYQYDSLYRVVQVSFGVGSPSPSTTSYQFDGVNNFVSRTENGVVTAFNARATGQYQPQAVNEYVRVAQFDLTGALLASDAPVHDPGGARIREKARRLFFDAFERLVEVDRSFDGGNTLQVVGAYTYDALGRRVTKNARVFDDAGGFVRAEQIAFVDDGSREIEEVSLSSGALVADYVYGSVDVDELVEMRRGGTLYYFHQNSISSTVALTDAAGNVVERYDYPSIYGKTQIEDAGGVSRPAAAEIGNPFRFQGRRFDDESQLYYFRNRYLDPEECRFVNRDPIGVWGDASNLGNGYAFCGGNPVNRRDPFGLDEITDAVDRIKELDTIMSDAKSKMKPGVKAPNFAKPGETGPQYYNRIYDEAKTEKEQLEKKIKAANDALDKARADAQKGADQAPAAETFTINIYYNDPPDINLLGTLHVDPDTVAANLTTIFQQNVNKNIKVVITQKDNLGAIRTGQQVTSGKVTAYTFTLTTKQQVAGGGNALTEGNKITLALGGGKGGLQMSFQSVGASVQPNVALANTIAHEIWLTTVGGTKTGYDYGLDPSIKLKPFGATDLEQPGFTSGMGTGLGQFGATNCAEGTTEGQRLAKALGVPWDPAKR